MWTKLIPTPELGQLVCCDFGIPGNGLWSSNANGDGKSSASGSSEPVILSQTGPLGRDDEDSDLTPRILACGTIVDNKAKAISTHSAGPSQDRLQRLLKSKKQNVLLDLMNRERHR